MVGIAETSAAISSLKAAMDIAKGIQALDSDAKIKLATIELMEKILSAQQDAFEAQQERATLLARIGELEAKIGQSDGWESEKQRYQLQEFPTGSMAYVLKAEAAADQPMHRICAACYEGGHKSILQTTLRHGGGEKVECPRCGSKLKLSEFPRIQARVTGHF
jgi:Zn finger protein HypA/HybF involved in hydrogenase expression